jgi:hypothetical protein
MWPPVAWASNGLSQGKVLTIRGGALALSLTPIQDEAKVGGATSRRVYVRVQILPRCGRDDPVALSADHVLPGMGRQAAAAIEGRVGRRDG